MNLFEEKKRYKMYKSKKKWVVAPIIFFGMSLFSVGLEILNPIEVVAVEQRQVNKEFDQEIANVQGSQLPQNIKNDVVRRLTEKRNTTNLIGPESGRSVIIKARKEILSSRNPYLPDAAYNFFSGDEFPHGTFRYDYINAYQSRYFAFNKEIENVQGSQLPQNIKNDVVRRLTEKRNTTNLIGPESGPSVVTKARKEILSSRNPYLPDAAYNFFSGDEFPHGTFRYDYINAYQSRYFAFNKEIENVQGSQLPQNIKNDVVRRLTEKRNTTNLIGPESGPSVVTKARKEILSSRNPYLPDAAYNFFSGDEFPHGTFRYDYINAYQSRYFAFNKEIESVQLNNETPTDQKKTIISDLEKYRSEINYDGLESGPSVVTKARKKIIKNIVPLINDSDLTKFSAQEYPRKSSRYIDAVDSTNRKEQAKADIDVEANKVKDTIDADTTLTAAEKEKQKTGVNQEAEKAKQAIDVAKDIDGINTAKADGILAINSQHVSSNPIDNRKEQAKADIDVEANKVKDTIDADTTLTAAEKEKQKTGVNQEAEKAKQAIDVAKDIDGINTAKADGILAINSQHVSSNPIDNRKEQAKADIDVEANKVKDTIDADTTLTAAEKEKQKTGVNQEAEKAKQAIDVAKDIDGINTAKADGILAINSQHVSSNPIDNRKEQAKADIDVEANKVKDTIDADTTLTAAEKEKQKTGVNQEAEKAKQAIDVAKDIDGINTAKADGILAINSQHVSSNPIDNRKEQAKADIDVEANKVKDTIDADTTLTAAEKEKQKTGVNQEAEKAKQAIDVAKDIDGINTAKADGILAINSQHVSSNPIDNRKEQAKADIDVEANKVKDTIDADTTLTAAEKEKQKTGVNQEAEKAKQAIDVAKDIDGINTAKADGILAINSQHVSSNPIDNRKEQAKADIDVEANKVKDTIDADTTLTAAEKEKQKTGVNQEAEKAKQAIDVAKDIDGINTAKADGILAINSQHVSSNPIDNRKEQAKADIDVEANKVKDTIDADTTLTAAEKEKQKTGVNQEAEKAKQAIDVAKDIDGINTAKADGILAINSQHVSSNPIDNRKEQAKADIDVEANKVKDTIDADTTLTAAEKEKQKTGVNQEAEKAKQAIDVAKDIDGINTAKADGILAINSQHVSSNPIDNRKEQAKADIDVEANKVKDTIDADTTLTAAEKEKQKTGVNQEAEKAKQAIDVAKDIDGINTAKADGILAINSQHVSSNPIDNRKEQAKADIDVEANKVKDTIDADTTLTAAEKEKQKTGVNQEAEKAKQAIDVAKDIDGINTAKADGILAINSQHVSSNPIDNRKEQAKADIDVEANKVKDTIDADTTLTAAEKEKQKTGVNQEAEKAKQAIDVAKDIDGINTAKAATKNRNTNYSNQRSLGNLNNKKIKSTPQLPKTGEKKSLLFILFGVLFSAISILRLLKLRKK